MLLPHLLHPASLQAWFPMLASVLITAAWQGLALTTAVACALRLFPSFSSGARSAIWTAVLILVATLPLFFTLPSYSLGLHPAVWHAEARTSAVLATLWFAASLFRLLQLIASALHLRRVLRWATPVATSEAVAALLREGNRPVSLCSSPDIDRPSVAGFLRPRILLPSHLLAELPEADLRHILLHEREHLRRRDDWINLLQQISLVLFPLSPALLWLNRRLAQERELACDDRVLRNTGARKAYAACLARVAEGSLVHRGLLLAISLLGRQRARGSGRSELARRVERILAVPQRTMGRVQMQLATGLLCTGLLGGTTLLAHSPELVSFGPATAPMLAQVHRTSTAMRPVGRPVPPVYIPAEYRLASSTMARPALVKAVMLPTSARANALTNTRTVRRTRVKTIAHRHWPLRSTVKSLLTAWHENTAVPTQPLPTTAVVPVLLRITPVNLDSSQVWYTAVHWQGGWLLVQI